jgi:hypothetical protein
VRRSFRHLLIGSAVTATLVGFASPASAAAVTVANWQMATLPTLVDSAGGDNNGTTHDVTLNGGYYSFNGTSSYATAPDKGNLDPGTATVKVTARVSITKLPRSAWDNFDVVRKGTSPTSGGYYKIEISRSASGAAIAACRFKDSLGRAGEAFGKVNLAGRGFVTITCTKTSAGVTLNVAGVETVYAPKTLRSIANNSPVLIGQKGDGTDSFAGLMDFVKIDIG